MGEYYIRQAEDGDVRGPFDEEQMTSLADAGQITNETQVTDEDKSAWTVVGESPELKAFLFPERKKLGLNKGAKKDVQMLNKPEDEAAAALTVEQMLAAAEGHTTDTKHLKDTQKSLDRAVAMSMPIMGAMLFLSGLAITLPRYQVIVDLVQGKFDDLAPVTFGVIGIVDFLFAVAMFLSVGKIMPLVRFRAMLGLGCFLYFYWSQGEMMGAIAAIFAGIGLFTCSVTLNFKILLASALVGLGATGYLAWLGYTAMSAAG